MSIGRPLSKIVSEEEYLANQTRIQEAQAVVDACKAQNEEAKRNYDREQLLKKIQEGKEAERLLQSMGSGSNSGSTLAIEGPTSQPMPTSASFIQMTGRQHQSQQPQWAQYGASTTTQYTPNTAYIHYQPPRPSNAAGPNTGIPPGSFQANALRNQGNPQIPYNQHPQPSGSSSVHYQGRGHQQRPLYDQTRARMASNHSNQVSVPQRTALPMYSVMPAQRTQQALQGAPRSQQQQQGQQQPVNSLPRVNSSQQLTSDRPPPNPAARVHLNILPSNPTVQPQSNAQPSYPRTSASIPNLVTNGYDTNNRPMQRYRPPAAPESSSLAGALDASRSNGSSSSTHPKTTSTTSNYIPQATLLGPTAHHLQHRLLSTSNPPSLPASTVSTTPISSTAIERPTSDITKTLGLGSAQASSSSAVPAHNAPKLILNGPSDDTLARLKIFAAQWMRTAQPHSYYNLTNSTIKIYKGGNEDVYIVYPDKDCQGKFNYISLASVESSKTDAQKPPPVSQTLYQDAEGNFQFLRGPLTAEQEKKYHPYSIPPHPANDMTVQSLTQKDKLTPVNIATHPALSSSSAYLPRWPAQADKKTIARDVLRALGAYPKRPRLESVETIPMQVPGKMQTTVDSQPSAKEPLRPQTNGVAFPPPLPSGSGIGHSFQSTQSHIPPQIIGPTTPLNMRTNSDVPLVILPSAEQSTPGPSTLLSEQTQPAPLLSNGSESSSSGQPRITISTPQPSVVHQTDKSRRQRTPLFLPSPSSSPPRIILDNIAAVTDDDDDDKESSASLLAPRITQPFYILVPPFSADIQKYRAQRSAKRKRQVSQSSGLGEASSSVRDEDTIDLDPTSHGFTIDDSEREAVRFSCSRLSERRCKWNGCDATMNSANSLIQHFLSEHSLVDVSKKRFACAWQHCNRRELTVRGTYYHTRSHAIVPLLCAYEDCEESFRTARQLMKHHSTDHNGDAPKPSASFFSPYIGLPPANPMTVPSFLIEPEVRQASMSKNRHATLGPWVLRNISGPVNLGAKRYNLTNKLLKSSAEGERQLGNQPYDFLSFPSTVFSTTTSQPSRIRDLDDLYSGEVSELVNDGLVLWHIPDKIKDEEEDILELVKAEEVLDKEENDIVDWVEPSITTRSLASEGPSDQMQHNSDEEAVETMLAGP